MPIAQIPKEEKQVDEEALLKAIQRGGGSTENSGDEYKTCFVQLRISRKFRDQIDELLSKRQPKPSRHNWLLIAIYEKFNRDQKALEE